MARISNGWPDQLDLYPELPDFVRMQVGLEWTELHSFCAASVHRV